MLKHIYGSRHESARFKYLRKKPQDAKFGVLTAFNVRFTICRNETLCKSGKSLPVFRSNNLRRSL
jgi:hypothetical protein